MNSKQLYPGVYADEIPKRLVRTPVTNKTGRASSAFPAKAAVTLRAITACVRTPGSHASVLFTGANRNAKAAACEVLTSKLLRNLYRVDLSKVVSKYIGETEKNLNRIFEAAERSGAILFFDNADALFGKRSRVKDAHDRYANQEVSYLLQKIESYHGLAILATNLKSAMDPSFLRRIRFIVNFPFNTPAKSMTKRVWKRVIR